ncbi:MAG: transporter substrate-binding domain-containing protein [SAR324 cluster bacterium]|nr:transporter substrate-binding domain-containing protein [SAR324 cluster bacterium]
MKKILYIFPILLLLQLSVQAQKLTILTEISPPGNFTENGQLKGIGVEIVNGILKRIHEDIQIKIRPWARAYKELKNKPNVALFSTTRTASRENLFKWVGPLFEVQWIFVSKKANNIKITSLEDAKKVKKIGVYRDDARDQFLREQGFTNLHTSVKPEHYVKMLLANKLDLISTTNIGLKSLCDRLEIPLNEFSVVYIMKTYQLYIAFSRQTSDEIVQKWDKAYQELKKEGVIKKVNEKWLGSWQ